MIVKKKGEVRKAKKQQNNKKQKKKIRYFGYFRNFRFSALM